MKSSTTLRGSAALAVIASTALLAACGRADEASMLQDARSRIQRDDPATAAVQLKSLLQQYPNSGEGRFLLGKALLRRGDARAAILELHKAYDLKFDADQVVPLLAKAYMARGEPGELIDRFGKTALKAPKARAELDASLALAHIMQGRQEQADKHLDAALQADPKNFEARVIKVRRMAGRARFEDSLKLVDELLAESPASPTARTLKGELLWLGQKDIEGGAAEFRRAVEAAPTNVTARVLLIQMHTLRRDVPAFRTEVEGLVKVAPASIEALYYRTQLALLDGKLPAAREGAQELLKRAPQYPPILQLAASIQLQTNDIEAAKKHLLQVITAQPNAHNARRMLAGAYLRSGQPERALSVLGPVLAQQPVDSETLGLAADAQLQAGHAEKAEQLYSAAAKADPSDAKSRVALALAQIVRGQAEAGIEQLRELAAADKTTYSDMALISALVSRSDTAAALQAIEGLLKKAPGKTQPYLMRGRLLRTQGKVTEARNAFEKALEIDPNYFPAITELAAIETSEQKFDKARQRFEAVLKREPRNITAALAVVEIRRLAGEKPEQIGAALREVVTSFPSEVAARVKLVEHHLHHRQAKMAVDAAEEASLFIANEPRLLNVLAAAQVANGNVREALATLRRVIALQPNTAEPHVRLADALVQARDYDGAARSLNSAIEIAPGALPLRQRQLDLALLRGQPNEALKVARAVQKMRPNEAAGHRMEADVHVRQKAWEPAIRSFKAALEREPAPTHAIRLHSTYVVSGRAREATSFTADWLQRFPKDAVYVFHLGQMAMDAGDHAAAEGHYRSVLDILPDNGAAMNNLTLALLRQRKNEEALKQAQRTTVAIPENAAVMDTMATVLVANGQSAQALEWQRKAVAKDPKNAAYRLSLAKLLIGAGDRRSAKVELEQLAAQGGRIAEHAEVSTLLKGL